mgnify:CR=1 FL=1
MGRKRPIEIKFRLSKEEYNALQKKLSGAGMNRNAFLVRLISDATIFPKEELMRMNMEYILMNRLLRGIGTNINQIAKRINAGGPVYEADLQEIRERLDEIWQLQRRILSNQL